MPNSVDRRDGDDEAVLACTGAFHLDIKNKTNLKREFPIYNNPR